MIPFVGNVQNESAAAAKSLPSCPTLRNLRDRKQMSDCKGMGEMGEWVGDNQRVWFLLEIMKMS